MKDMLKLARVLTLTSYFSLIVFVVAWYAWLAPSKYFPVSLTLLFMVVPLLIPLRGLLAGRIYTHQWTSFLVLFYFAHGLSQAWAIEEDRIFANTEAGLSFILFCALVAYVRLQGKLLKAP